MTDNPFADWVLDIERLNKTGEKHYLKRVPEWAKDVTWDEDAPKPSRKRGINAKTRAKILKLLLQRMDDIREGMPLLSWRESLKQADGLDHKTAKNYLPGLYENWNNPKYRGDIEYQEFCGIPN